MSPSAHPSATAHAVLARAGELDLSSAPALLAEARAALAHGARRIVVDLRGVTFADSTALAVLIQVRRATVAQGGDLVLVAPGGPVGRLLALTGLDAVFTLADDPDQAAAAA